MGMGWNRLRRPRARRNSIRTPQSSANNAPLSRTYGAPEGVLLIRIVPTLRDIGDS
jgi:hypothetical protein